MDDTFFDVLNILRILYIEKKYTFSDGTSIGMNDDYSIGYVYKRTSGEKYISTMIKLSLKDLEDLIIKNGI